MIRLFTFSNLSKAMPYRIGLYPLRFNSSVKDWLTKKGYDSSTVDGVLKAFPDGSLSVNDLNMLGDTGLKELIASVAREKKTSENEQLITIHINVPHENYSFSVKAPVGGNFYTLSKTNQQLGSYLEGACSGICACSTCHVIVDQLDYAKIPPPDDSEMDMIDLASSYTDTSRLGCQITFTPALDGLRVSLPKDYNNLFDANTGNGAWSS